MLHASTLRSRDLLGGLGLDERVEQRDERLPFTQQRDVGVAVRVRAAGADHRHEVGLREDLLARVHERGALVHEGLVRVARELPRAALHDHLDRLLGERRHVRRHHGHSLLTRVGFCGYSDDHTSPRFFTRRKIATQLLATHAEPHTAIHLSPTGDGEEAHPGGSVSGRG
jgi:hypothetical protein